jgi:hypothetical protein
MRGWIKVMRGEGHPIPATLQDGMSPDHRCELLHNYYALGAHRVMHKRRVVVA